MKRVFLLCKYFLQVSQKLVSGNDDDENSKFKWALETSRRTDGGLDYAREFLGNACRPLFTFCMLLHSMYTLVNDDFFIVSLCLQEFVD